MQICHQRRDNGNECEDSEMLEGDLPNKQKKLVVAWMEIHKDELIANWELAVVGEHPYKIESLK